MHTAYCATTTAATISHRAFELHICVGTWIQLLRTLRLKLADVLLLVNGLLLLEYCLLLGLQLLLLGTTVSSIRHLERSPHCSILGPTSSVFLVVLDRRLVSRRSGGALVRSLELYNIEGLKTRREKLCRQRNTLVRSAIRISIPSDGVLVPCLDLLLICRREGKQHTPWMMDS